MPVDVDEYVNSFRTDLCDAMAAWAGGAKFGEIMKMTDIFEVMGCAALSSHIDIATCLPKLQPGTMSMHIPVAYEECTCRCPCALQ
jgi:hypothetical protein